MSTGAGGPDGRADGTRRVDALAERYVDERAALDPYLATFVGIAGHDDRVSDLSPAGFAAVEELVRRTRAEAERTPAVDERERVARAALLERLGLEAEVLASGAAADLNVVDSPLQATRLVFDLVPVATEADRVAVARRLAATPGALAAYRTTLSDQASRLPPARRQVLACAEQARTWAGADGLFATYAEGVAAADGTSPALAADLRRAGAACAAAAAETAQWLEDSLAPRARTRDAVGRERYALASQYFLGEVVDLEETYAWGLDEAARILADMRVVARDILGAAASGLAEDELVDAAVAALEADPARRIAGPQAFVGWMQELSDRSLHGLHGTHFDIPEPVRVLECRIAPTTAGGIYYTAPSEDFSRPGTMWWSVQEGLVEFSTWQTTTTVFHEGVPGHHLQLGQVAYNAALLNRWQRTMCVVSGHAEGWALYAERLMAELGWLDDPGDRLGMLDAQLVRAARVVVDIGMHLELAVPTGSAWRPGETWTPELGWEYLRAHSRLPEPMLRFELDRYLGWPGQAPSYKVGERIWLAARADAQRRAGTAFDLAAWHRAALDLGSMGLGPLREALARV